MIYLDNAATGGKKPQSVINAVNKALLNLNANPGRSGHKLSVLASEKVFETRGKIAALVGSENESTVCFMQNCTHAINAVLHGVLKSGDHIIISSLEHNAVWRPINYLKEFKGIEYDIADVDLFNDENTILNIESLIKPNTRMVFVTSASNVVGKRLPLKSIGEVCRNRNIYFGVDGAQSVGVIPIDMQKMNIDYLCIAPHKGLYAPMGVGVLVARKSVENVLISGGTGSNSYERFQPEELPERLESGTLNLPAIVGCSAGIDFANSVGISNIYKKDIELCKLIFGELRSLKAVLYTEEPDIYRYAPLVSFNIRGYGSEEVGEYLGRHDVAVRSGLHCAPLAHKTIGTSDKGTVRVSPSIFNDESDINRLIFLLKRLI